MNKIRNIFVLLLVAVIGLVLVGCKEPEEEPVEPTLPAPTELAVEPSIYDGGEEKLRYVLVGNNMYIDAIVNDGADEEVTWSIDRTDRATLEVEDGRAVLKGLKAGNVTVTAASVKAPELKASVTIEVCSTSDFQAAIIAMKDEIVAALPECVAANFKLPTTDNENFKITYKSDKNDLWADGIFHYDSYQGKNSAGEAKTIAGAYKGADTKYAFSVVIEYKGSKLTQALEIKLVDNLEVNSYTAIDYATKKIKDATKYMTEEVSGQKLYATVDKSVVDEKKSTPGCFIYSQNGLPAWKLPGNIAAADAGKDVEISWEVADVSGALQIVAPSEAGGEYTLLLTKPIVDKRAQINAQIKVGETNDIVKIFIVCRGYDPEEVVAYMTSNKLIPAADASTTGLTMPLYNYDSTKKFTTFVKKGSQIVITGGVSVVWTVADESVATYVEASAFLKRVAKGTTTIHGVFYYGFSQRTIMVDKLDAQGNLVKDAQGNVVQEEQIQEIYEWKYELDLTITFK